MNQSLLILGATLPTGRWLVLHALEAGYSVTAMLQNPNTHHGLPDHPRLEIVLGDAVNYVDVFNAVQGNDVILSALGSDDKNLRSLIKGTENILYAIRHSSIRQFICLSAVESNDAGFMGECEHLRIGFRRQKSFQASAHQELLLYKSTSNFTLVKTDVLVNDENYRAWKISSPEEISMDRVSSFKMDREAVALFMISLISDPSWNRKTVFLVGGDD